MPCLKHPLAHRCISSCPARPVSPYLHRQHQSASATFHRSHSSCTALCISPPSSASVALTNCHQPHQVNYIEAFAQVHPPPQTETCWSLGCRENRPVRKPRYSSPLVAGGILRLKCCIRYTSERGAKTSPGSPNRFSQSSNLHFSPRAISIASEADVDLI